MLLNYVVPQTQRGKVSESATYRVRCARGELATTVMHAHAGRGLPATSTRIASIAPKDSKDFGGSARHVSADRAAEARWMHGKVTVFDAAQIASGSYGPRAEDVPSTGSISRPSRGMTSSPIESAARPDGQGARVRMRPSRFHRRSHRQSKAACRGQCRRCRSGVVPRP